ncbi:MAG: type II toxin-antitoxin system VapC family toxin [Pseudomonadota bacterium]
MVIDSSAILCILLGEPEAGDCAQALAGAGRCVMSAFSLLEAALVIAAKKGPAGGRELDLLVHKARIQVAALTPEHVELARTAWLKYGKGRHAAGLNIGDCCSYALSKYIGETILFKGNDFSQTDIDGMRLA